MNTLFETGMRILIFNFEDWHLTKIYLKRFDLEVSCNVVYIQVELLRAKIIVTVTRNETKRKTSLEQKTRFSQDELSKL